MSIFKGINGYTVLKRYDPPSSTKGNLIIPDSDKEKPMYGEIIHTDPTFNYHNNNYVLPQVFVGDIVLIPRLGSIEISLNGEDYIFCQTNQLIALYVKEN